MADLREGLAQVQGALDKDNWHEYISAVLQGPLEKYGQVQAASDAFAEVPMTGLPDRLVREGGKSLSRGRQAQVSGLQFEMQMNAQTHTRTRVRMRMRMRMEPICSPKQSHHMECRSLSWVQSSVLSHSKSHAVTCQTLETLCSLQQMLHPHWHKFN